MSDLLRLTCFKSCILSCFPLSSFKCNLLKIPTLGPLNIQQHFFPNSPSAAVVVSACGGSAEIELKAKITTSWILMEVVTAATAGIILAVTCSA